ncbi:MAG: FMN-binding protein [Gemmatimonadota bacterium]|nr:FMN-binding protein [Gemmatimonadota bacterium]MDH5759499.1 FMN-binding protein [Gemmatimonadota bacterium]
MRTLAVAAVLLATAAAPGGASAQGLTQDEALRLAFPTADAVERRTAYLDDAQLERARALAGTGVEVKTTVVTHYVATVAGAPLGVAYFDPHRVRTLAEVLMIVVDPDGRIRRMEVVSFREPPEYRPPPGWLAQFHGRELDGDLSLKGEIPNITGATLTSGAATDAARRVLALHAVIDPFASSAGDEDSR